MSIVIEDTLEQLERTPASVVAGTDYLLVALTAGLARDQNQTIERTPAAAEPAHGDVVGDKPKSVRNKFAREARWIVAPPQPAPS